MKYFALVWAGLWRKRARTFLTMLSVVVAFLLYGLLQGFNQGIDSAVAGLNANRLYVLNKIHITNSQPLSHMNRLKTVPGVLNVAHLTYFGGFYQNARNPIPAFAANVDQLMQVFAEFELPPEQLQAMLRTRTGAVVGKPLADQHGWKLGQRVPIGTSIWTQKNGGSTWQFEIVGIYNLKQGAAGAPPNFFLINYDYFDEARSFRNGTVHNYYLRIDDLRNAKRIADTVDGLFANSAFETRTETEKAFAQMQLKQIGDINLIANSIVGAVFFTLLFLTANTMMQSVRERIPELAVLKTLGYSDGKVLMLVMIESILLCVLAGLIGLSLAALAFPLAGSVMPGIQMPAVTVLIGIVLAALVAVASGLPPAWRAKQLNIVDALAGR